MQITQKSMTSRMLLRHTKAWLSLVKLCSCHGMASAAKPSAISKGMLDEIWNLYWAKVLTAEEEALQNIRPWQQLDFVPIHAVKEEDIRKAKKGQFLHKNYTFGKPFGIGAEMSDVLDIIQTSLPIKPLHYPFEPSTEPPPTNTPLDLAQWRQAFTKARIYLLGVNHNKKASQEDAKKLIHAVQPDILMLELCPKRTERLLLTDAELEQRGNLPFEKYRKEQEAKRQEQGYPPAAYLPRKKQLELEAAQRRTWQQQCKFHEKLLHQGDEFRAAFMEAKQVPGCAGVVLGDNLDRSLKIFAKIKKQIPIYRFWMRLKAKWLSREFSNYQQRLWNGHYTDEEAVAKQEEFLERYNQIWHPEFGEHIIHARNRNMIRVLHTIAHRCTIEKFCASQKEGVPFEPLTVVAVVGAAHLYGITNEWAKPEVVYKTTTKC